MSLKRRCLYLKEKLAIIEESEKYNISARKLAKKFGVGKTQVQYILKNKTELKKVFEEGKFKADQKRKFPKKTLEIDQIVYDWFCKAKNTNVPISGPLLKEKALEVSENLKVNDFKASNGWLDGFCKRHDIHFKTICDKSPDVDEVSNPAESPQPIVNQNIELVPKNEDDSSVSYEDAQKFITDTRQEIDECDALGISWAAKVRRLDEDQKVLAEDLINQVLRRAYFKELTRNTEIHDSSCKRGIAEDSLNMISFLQNDSLQIKSEKDDINA